MVTKVLLVNFHKDNLSQNLCEIDSDDVSQVDETDTDIIQKDQLGTQWEREHKNSFIFNQYYESSLKDAEGNKEASIAFGLNMRKF